MQVSAPGESFSLVFWWKLWKNMFLQDLSSFSKDFLSYVANNRIELGFVTPIKLPGEAVESLSG